MEPTRTRPPEDSDPQTQEVDGGGRAGEGGGVRVPRAELVWDPEKVLEMVVAAAQPRGSTRWPGLAPWLSADP